MKVSGSLMLNKEFIAKKAIFCVKVSKTQRLQRPMVQMNISSLFYSYFLSYHVTPTVSEQKIEIKMQIYNLSGGLHMKSYLATQSV